MVAHASVGQVLHRCIAQCKMFLLLTFFMLENVDRNLLLLAVIMQGASSAAAQAHLKLAKRSAKLGGRAWYQRGRFLVRFSLHADNQAERSG
jgi:hypothetical protein